MKLTALFLSCVITQVGFAQKVIPVINAKSNMADIRVDGELVKGAWRIVPTAKLDVFTTAAKRVTFITDVDSIHYKIKPKHGIYNFAIVLNGKDTAFTQIKYQPTRLSILQKAGKYNAADDRFIPAFTYQSADNADLQRIRKELNLDSIAGKGPELTQVFNLLHWLHNLVKHDGGSNNPTIKNAVEIIKVCKTENRGVNCRMMATVLNECYLAMGIQSRYITCMPKETQFDDCHVINMVYSKTLNKWIWIDPTFDAFVMNEKGELLGIAEVRERLVKGQPLILNADANWNREALKTKGSYLDNYMAKNLYRLQTPVVSEYNSETWATGKVAAYVELLPLDGIEQAPQKKEYANNKTGVQFTYYKTNNPALFWTKPGGQGIIGNGQ